MCTRCVFDLVTKSWHTWCTCYVIRRSIIGAKHFTNYYCGVLCIYAQHKTKLKHVEAVMMHGSEQDLNDHIVRNYNNQTLLSSFSVTETEGSSPCWQVCNRRIHWKLSKLRVVMFGAERSARRQICRYLAVREVPVQPMMSIHQCDDLSAFVMSDHVKKYWVSERKCFTFNWGFGSHDPRPYLENQPKTENDLL